MIVANASDRARLLQHDEDVRGLASLPIINDWAAWWRVWGPKLVAAEGRQGWILFLLDAQEKLVEAMVTMSRVIRNKPSWGGGWSEKEWSNIEETTAGARAWFERNCPDPKTLPEYAQFLVSGQHGLFCVLSRMGRELRALQTQGYSTVVLEAGDGSLACTSGGDKFLQEVA